MEGVLVKIDLSLIFEPRLRWNPMRSCNFRCGVTLVKYGRSNNRVDFRGKGG